MGRLIDADKIIFREIDEIGGDYEPYLGCSKSQIDSLPTVNAIVIPDNATNGDILKSLLTITDEWTAYNYAEDCKEVNVKADGIIGVSSFKKSWWDAPFGR